MAFGVGLPIYPTNYPPKEVIAADAQTNAANIAANPQYIWTKNYGAWGGSQHGPTVAQYVADQKQSRFNSIFPLLTQALAGGGSFGEAKGSGTLPTISTGPVYDPQMIQQQINSSRANTDTSVASRSREAQQSLAGKGFSSQSPLLSALQGGFQMQGMAQKEAAGREIPFQAAQANASQLLGTQQARSQQELGLRKIQADQAAAQISALLSALSGLG